MARPRSGQRQQQTDDDDDTAAGLSDDQRSEIIDLVNAAVGSHIKRKLPQIVSGALEKPLGEIRALIENGAGRQARRDDDDQEPDPDEPEEPTARRTTRDRGAIPTRQAARDRREDPPTSRRGGDPEVAKLQAKMARMEQEREAERTAARNSERDGMLREMLGAVGVDKNRIRGAVAVLRDSMRYDDKSREWAFVAKRDGLDEDLDPDVGIKEWAATDEGKSYLAPPGAGSASAGAAGVQRRSGAGTRVTGGARGSTAPVADAKTAKTQQVAQAQQTLATAIDALSGGIVPLG